MEQTTVERPPSNGVRFTRDFVLKFFLKKKKGIVSSSRLFSRFFNVCTGTPGQDRTLEHQPLWGGL